MNHLHQLVEVDIKLVCITFFHFFKMVKAADLHINVLVRLPRQKQLLFV